MKIYPITLESRHWAEDRRERALCIKNIIGGIGKPLFQKQVNTGHPNGPELHTITSNGIIVIHNAITGRLVTMLIARPKQLEKYGFTIPEYVLRKAKHNQKMGYNEL